MTSGLSSRRAGCAAPDRRPWRSVVVPLFDEEPCVAPLVAAVRAALGDGDDWELLLVDDGSRDGTARVAREVVRADPRVRLLRLARNYGQSAALQAGFDHARGEVIVSMDGDLQNDPADIATLLAALEEGHDLVVGRRVGRQDAWLSRRLPSWLANLFIRQVTGLPLHDVGCTLKAYRRSLLVRLELYADRHRFIPVLAAANCAARIVEVPVRHHPRRFGRSKYGIGRVPRVLADLLVVKTILTFHDRPLTLYGMAAVGVVLFAGALATTLVGRFLSASGGGLVLGGVVLLLLALGAHLFLLGVLCEVLLQRWMPRGGRDATLVEAA